MNLLTQLSSLAQVKEEKSIRFAYKNFCCFGNAHELFEKRWKTYHFKILYVLSEIDGKDSFKRLKLLLSSKSSIQKSQNH